MDVVGKRYLYFGISLHIIIPGIIALSLWGFPLAIDFTGGSLLDITFDSGKAPEAAKIIELYSDLDIGSAQVQSSGVDSLIIRSKDITNEQKTEIVKEITKRFNGSVRENRFETIGPAVGSEVAERAGFAVGIAAIGILLYITFAFRGIPHAYRFGTAAIIAMLHDILVIVGLEAIFGKFLGWEVDSMFLTALLTIIGFSVHDTIVVFDRIRENSNIYRRRLPFDTIVNHSIVQTFNRSIITSLTVVFTLLAMALFGGVTIRHFVIVLLIGIIAGTYSSIFNAAQILVVWENREWNQWFKRKPTEA
jgi:preprotein translocase subunit SecF